MNIIFEGIDASGKTTLIRELQGYLNYKGIKNQVIADVKEPTPLLPVFQQMFSTNFLEVEANFKTSIYQTLLFACSHFYVQEQNRENKHITIYDRDIFTLLSYQKELIKQEYPDNYEQFFNSFRKMMMFENKPIDLLVYVHIPLEENIRRKIGRDGIEFTDRERETLAIFKRNMEEEIKSFINKNPNVEFLSLDGRVSPEENCLKLVEAISRIKNKNLEV